MLFTLPVVAWNIVTVGRRRRGKLRRDNSGNFSPRDAMLAPYDLWPRVSSVFLLQVGVLWKRLNASSWFLPQTLRSTYPALCCKEILVGLSVKNKGSSLWNFVRNSGLRKISPRHIDRGNWKFGSWNAFRIRNAIVENAGVAGKWETSQYGQQSDMRRVYP